MTPPRSMLRRRLRKVHRWLAVLAGGYFLLMALSGVLLNHRQLLAGLDLPRAWLPGDYAFRNWNRNALRGAVVDGDGKRYLFGEAGVWRTSRGAVTVPLMEGFPSGAYRRDTRALLWVDGAQSFLLAATRNGLFARMSAPDGATQWEPVPLPADDPEPELVDLLRAGDRVIAMTRSRLYAADPAWPPVFFDITPERAADPDLRLPLFRLLFHAHSGEVWGTPGTLLVDSAGVILGLFTLSGIWFWWRRRRGTVARGRLAVLCRRGLRGHLRLGPWCAALLLLVALTGLFQRPPFLVAVARVTYPPRLHPAPRSPNPWHDVLRKAAYDPRRGKLLLATDDGFFQGPLDGSAAFARAGSGPPVSVMGASVLRRQPDGMYWVGSMSGLYVWDLTSGWVTDAFTGNPPMRGFGRPVGEHAISGLLFSESGRPLVVDYFEGVIGADGNPVALPVPDALAGGGRISLWHALFELHNGRILGFLLGWWSWAVVPLGGLALAAETVTGLVARLRTRRSHPKPSPQAASF